MLGHLRSLMDLDISWNGLRPNAHLKKFLEALGANRNLQYLNLSWNSLMYPPLTQAPKQQSPREEEKKKKEEKPDEYT